MAAPKESASSSEAPVRGAAASEATKKPPGVLVENHKANTSRPAGCDTPIGAFKAASEAQFRTLVTGAWILCDPPSVFGTGEAGLLIRADGTWSKLERRPNGAYAIGEGFEQEGTWDTFDTSDMNGPNTYQINLLVAGGGQVPNVPRFGEGSSGAGLTKLSFQTHTGEPAYVPAPPDTRFMPVPFPPADGKGCEAREEPYRPATEAEFRSAIMGTWLVCGTPSMFGTDEAGLEIRADGRWAKLYRVSNSTLLRGEGGTWETIDTSSVNGGRPTFQLNLNHDGDGTSAIAAELAGSADEVTKARMRNYILVADYVPAPARTVVTG